jgi:hypothetical protein
MAVSPAAGPDTLSDDLLRAPTNTPPIIPATTPEKTGAPDACAIPKHKGKATKKTTILDAKLACTALKALENMKRN